MPCFILRKYCILPIPILFVKLAFLGTQQWRCIYSEKGLFASLFVCFHLWDVDRVSTGFELFIFKKD